MDLPTIHVRWSTPLPLEGPDAPPLPAAAGVYEIVYEEAGSLERVYVGQTDDLRCSYASHRAGANGHPELHRVIQKNVAFFRYWTCEDAARRFEVVSALGDLHYYECGREQVPDVSCVRLVETH